MSEELEQLLKNLKLQRMQGIYEEHVQITWVRRLFMPIARVTCPLIRGV
jgi:hypothetical protein